MVYSFGNSLVVWRWLLFLEFIIISCDFCLFEKKWTNSQRQNPCETWFVKMCGLIKYNYLNNRKLLGSYNMSLTLERTLLLQTKQIKYNIYLNKWEDPQGYERRIALYNRRLESISSWLSPTPTSPPPPSWKHQGPGMLTNLIFCGIPCESISKLQNVALPFLSCFWKQRVLPATRSKSGGGVYKAKILQFELRVQLAIINSENNCHMYKCKRILH